jgi:16S rRNA (adenine1518-N6/adenine1519-N6)-dimethyltransferase
LTRELIEKGFRVRAIELDQDLSDHLQMKFKDIMGTSLEVENIDAIKILKNEGDDIDRFIVSNLPYNISSSLMGFLLDSVDMVQGTTGFKGAIIMFQKEFGERLTASHGGKDYGRISVMFQLKMEHEVLFTVPRDRFYPPPKVDGMVIRFWPREKVEDEIRDERTLKDTIHAAFLNRRKKLRNSLHGNIFHAHIDEGTIIKVLEEMNIADERPERLSPEKFVELSNALFDAAVPR